MRINSFRYDTRKILLLILAIVVFASTNFYTVDAFSIGENADRKVYIGGFPVGLAIKTDGVMVEKVVQIDTIAGSVTPKTNIKSGDIIQKINDTKVVYASDIIEELDKASELIKNVTVRVKRGNANINIECTLLREELSGKYKLGLAVKEGIAGVGTVSFIKKDGSYASLGHPISDGENANIVPCHSGSIYDCKIVGYTKGQKGRAGELKGVFVGEAIGDIEKNCKSGIYGKFNDYSSQENLVSVAPRESVKAGKAQIISTINKDRECFDIEIIRAIGQNSPDDKGMVLRVTDRRLLGETGGIVQGMSGSPILQNGKLVGAVTHVFLNDPTKGYGIYSDFMYDA